MTELSMVSLPSRVSSRLTCLRPIKGEYCRTRELPALLRLWPSDVEHYSYPGTLKIVALLRDALRGERRRGRSSHWAYDLNRHMGLMSALKAERDRLAMLGRCLPPARAVAAKPAATGRERATLHLPYTEKGA